MYHFLFLLNYSMNNSDNLMGKETFCCCYISIPVLNAVFLYLILPTPFLGGSGLQFPTWCRDFFVIFVKSEIWVKSQARIVWKLLKYVAFEFEIWAFLTTVFPIEINLVTLFDLKARSSKVDKLDQFWHFWWAFVKVPRFARNVK